MGIDAITLDIARAFEEHIAQRFGVDIERKDNDDVMGLVGSVLGLLGVLDRKRFLTQFATTIDQTIWIPKRYREDTTPRGLFVLMKLLVHETTHAGDAKKGGTQAMIDYADAEWRAQKEALAYAAGLELEVAITGVLPPLDDIGSSLHGPQCAYALDARTREFARGILEQSAVSIANGVHTSEVALEAIGWLRGHAPRVLHGGAA